MHHNTHNIFVRPKPRAQIWLKPKFIRNHFELGICLPPGAGTFHTHHPDLSGRWLIKYIAALIEAGKINMFFLFP